MTKRIASACSYIILALSVSGNKKEVAKQLALTPDHISRELRRYENDLGVTVFEKRGNRLCLTSIGSKIIRLEALHEKNIKRLINSTRSEQLRIGFSNSTLACAFLSPIIGYLGTHPSCKSALNIYPYEELEAKLSAGMIDIAVTSSYDTMIPGQNYRYSGEYELSLLTMKDDPISVSESFITPSVAGLKSLITSEDLYDELIGKLISYDNTFVGYANDMLLVMALTYEGFGCGICPYFTERSYDFLPFRAMPFYPPLRTGFTISVSKDKGSVARADPFLKMLREDPSRYHMIFK